MNADTVPISAARRLLMDGAGLTLDPSRRATTATVYQLIERLGFVQIDSINVVERAHHHILWTRLQGYQPQMLARLHERDRRLFEHWTHDASLIPTQWFPHWRPRFARSFESKWWKERLGPEGPAIAAGVLERIRADGPLLSRDFEHASNGRAGGWWEWKPAKAALEYLWRTGELAVARRVNFQKVYDLTERVLPAEAHSAPAPDREAHIDWACRTALDRLGVATPREVAAFWAAISAAEAAQWCAAAGKRGEVVAVTVATSGGSADKPVKAFAWSDWPRRLAELPEPGDVAPAVRLLSPFDPLVRDRKRLARLFGFQYTFEAFTPAAKRQYGYFVLPILAGDRFIGRLNPALDRERGVLEVAGLWWEPGVRPTRGLRDGLDQALTAYAAFNGADRWIMSRSAARAARG